MAKYGNDYELLSGAEAFQSKLTFERGQRIWRAELGIGRAVSALFRCEPPNDETRSLDLFVECRDLSSGLQKVSLAVPGHPDFDPTSLDASLFREDDTTEADEITVEMPPFESFCPDRSTARNRYNSAVYLWGTSQIVPGGTFDGIADMGLFFEISGTGGETV